MQNSRLRTVPCASILSLGIRLGLALVLWSSATPVLSAQQSEPEPAVRVVPETARELDVTLGEPVVVATSEVYPAGTNYGSYRWGYHQFPKISRMPGGEILLTFNVCPDDNATYGHPGPAYVSGDEGRTWSLYEGKEKSIAISHSPILAVGNGEFLCVPFPVGMETKHIEGMPKPVGSCFCYSTRYYYRLDQCPKVIQDYVAAIRAYRWTPATKAWKEETIEYEMRNALIRTSGTILARTSFEWPLVEVDRELFVGDYKFCYAHKDGSIPKAIVVTCMVSRDNGRSFQRRGEIAYDPAAGDVNPLGETAIARTTRGDLISISRASADKQRPMVVSFSRDRGWTWSKRAPLMEFGVMPNLLMLDSGVLALSFGRPGVHLSFSPDGSGRTWTLPMAVREGSHGAIYGHSCGYTSLLKLGRNEFLLAYSGFQQKDQQGQLRKAILVRKITVRPRE